VIVSSFPKIRSKFHHLHAKGRGTASSFQSPAKKFYPKISPFACQIPHITNQKRGVQTHFTNLSKPTPQTNHLHILPAKIANSFHI